MNSDKTVLVDIRQDFTLMGRVDHDDERIFLPLLGARTGSVLLTMTTGGALNLLDEIERRLAELAGEEPICPRCHGTGDLWIPVAPGAVCKSTCDCGPRYPVTRRRP